MSNNIYINFFGSSSFVVGILENILENQGRTLSSVFDEQINWLKSGNANTSTISACWLQMDFQSFKKTYSTELGLLIQPGLVVSQPDRENRGKTISSPVSSYARTNALDLFTPEKINQDIHKYTELSKKNSATIVASYGQIINQQIIEANSYGFINWHPSLLPKYRGPTPMQTTLVNGDQLTGLSWIEVEAKMDAGVVLLQLVEELTQEENIHTLQEKMQNLGKNTWALALAANITRYKEFLRLQDEAEATFCSKLNKEDALVYPQEQDADDIYNHWRAYLGYPGTTFLDDIKFKSQVKLTTLLKSDKKPQGLTVYEDKYWVQKKEGKKLKCYLKCLKDSYVQVLTIRLSSGKELNLSGYNFG